MKYSIDSILIRENTISVTGWAIGDTLTDTVNYRVETTKREPVKFQLIPLKRYDITREMFQADGEYEFGFTIKFLFEQGTNYRLIFSCGSRKLTEHINPVKISSQKEQIPTPWTRLKKLMRPRTVLNGFAYLKDFGFQKFWEKTFRTIKGQEADYMKWRREVLPDGGELERQRHEQFAYMPKFSIIVPVFRTPEKDLRAMIDSVREQTYAGWELCLADGSGAGSHTQKILESYAKKDGRIRFYVLEKNEGISENTNAALKMASGDYLVLADHDDLLTPDALYWCAAALNRPVRPDVIYSDEDKVTADGRQFTEPHFKPDFNPDYLRNVNYICHLFVVSAELLQRTGGFRKEYDGAQDYDFIFRCTEAAREIYHIPRVLYHWRISATSTAADPEKKRYAFEAGARAIQDHCARVGLGVKVEPGMVPGYYHTTYELKDRPLISVIIPTKDHSADLKVCLESIFTKSKYPNLEFILVENNSTEPETFAYYRELEKTHSNVHVVEWKDTFNYSKINNFGVSFAKGEYLLFLNNDVELINGDCIEEMLSYCQRDEVGIVGARLLYPDNTIQHAGVVVGFGGIAGHTFIGLYYQDKSYFLRASCAQDYSAVTAACMMTKRSVFDAAGGFYDGLAVAFNDVDFCMKVRSLGKLVVYTPYAMLHHYESKSRGLEDTPEKIERFQHEIETFRKRWPEILENGDPYYNVNLTLRGSHFGLRDWEREPLRKPSEPLKPLY